LTPKFGAKALVLLLLHCKSSFTKHYLRSLLIYERLDFLAFLGPDKIIFLFDLTCQQTVSNNKTFHVSAPPAEHPFSIQRDYE